MKRLRRLPVAMLVAILLATGLMPTVAPNGIALAQAVGDPADQLLADAAENMLDYDTMKFDLIYEHGSTKLYTGIKMTKASGAIQRPGKMKATVQTKIGFVKINVNATVNGDHAEVRAVGIEEDYTLPGDLAHIIADPVLLLPDLASAVVDPVVTKVETNKKGQTLTWVSGTFDPKSAAGRSSAWLCGVAGRAPRRYRYRREWIDCLGPHTWRVCLAGFKRCRTTTGHLWVRRSGQYFLIRPRKE